MANRNKERLAALNTAMSGDSVEDADDTRSTRSGVGTLLKRTNTLNQIASGAKRTVQHLMHAPNRIRLWSGHNRDYQLLSVERCADLIEGFTRTGSQEFPAIVRKVSDDDDFDFEVVCGARRHWTANHLSWPLLVEVRELDDRQAFILQDLENRDREDVSDYERAVDYKKALPRYFENSRSAMAKFLEIDKGNFHRLLELADLPKPVVEAYGDLRELKVHHGTAYRKLIADPAVKRRLLDRAKNLKGQGLIGAKVFSTLKDAARSSRGSTIKPRSIQKHGTIEAVRQPGTERLALTIAVGADPSKITEADIETLRVDFESVLADLRTGRL